MDGPARPAAISRIDSRYRYQAQKLPQHKLPGLNLHHHQHEPLAHAGRDANPGSRERMTRSHRFFHRRAAQADPDVVVVEVINKVDESGNVISQETLIPGLSNALPTTVPQPLPDVNLPAVPSVPSVPNVPDVPNVPVPSLPPVPVPEVPAVPVPEVPAVPVSALPAAPIPALPAAPIPALPTVAVPALPTVPPSVPAPELPSVPVPGVPSAPVPQLPTVPVPTLPSVPVPAVPDVPVPALPSVPVPSLPSVPAPPTVPVPVLPSVPAVPPFPTSLHVPSVPAYPFPSLFPVAHAVSPSASTSTQGVETTSTPSVPVPAPISAINSATNSTLSTPASLIASTSLASFDSISASKPTDVAVSIQAVPSAQTSDLQYLPSSVLASFTQTLITSHSARSTSSASKPTSTTIQSSTGGAGGFGVGGVPAPTSTATSEAAADSSPSALETPKVIGSVLGSLAGAALILALILLLLRRHKQRRGGALQLTGDERTTSNDRSMTQAATATSPFVPIAFLNRFSGMSGKTAETNSSGGERSFQRVSGRKLPSAFSEGMTSDQFSGGGTMSGSSFYQDDHGVYGGPGMSKEFGKEIGDTSATRESGQMNIRPSPARTPIIRHPDDENPFADRHHLSPPHSPVAELPPRGTLGRSLPSADGSRSSKFTENV